MVTTMTEVIEQKKRKLRLTEPKQWQVIMLNDDFTTMEFVMAMLMQIFRHKEEEAHKLMLQIHTEGSAIVGRYTFEIAESKCVETTTIARSNGFPLQLKVAQD